MNLIQVYETLEVGSTLDISMLGYVPQEIFSIFEEEGYSITTSEVEGDGMEAGITVNMQGEDGAALRVDVFFAEFEIYLTKLS